MKKVCAFALALVLGLMLCSCGTGSLPDGMDADAAEAKAKEVVAALNDRDFETLAAMFDGLEKYDVTPLTAEEWEAQADAIEEQLDPGDFEGYTTTRFSTMQDTTFGEYGIVVLGCKYKNKSYAWQVSFDMDMDCIGLRV